MLCHFHLSGLSEIVNRTLRCTKNRTVRSNTGLVATLFTTSQAIAYRGVVRWSLCSAELAHLVLECHSYRARMASSLRRSQPYDCWHRTVFWLAPTVLRRKLLSLGRHAVRLQKTFHDHAQGKRRPHAKFIAPNQT